MIDAEQGLKLKHDQSKPRLVLGAGEQSLGEEKLKYSLICEVGMHRRSAALPCAACTSSSYASSFAQICLHAALTLVASIW